MLRFGVLDFDVIKQWPWNKIFQQTEYNRIPWVWRETEETIPRHIHTDLASYAEFISIAYRLCSWVWVYPCTIHRGKQVAGKLAKKNWSQEPLQVPYSHWKCFNSKWGKKMANHIINNNDQILRFAQSK